MHMIENSKTTGKAEMAYAGETPWHGLGQALTPGAPLEQWEVEAGFNWEARLARVQYEAALTDPNGVHHSKMMDTEHKIIYRSDTGANLGHVSGRYKVVQPHDIIEFWRDLTEKFGFQLETAGLLQGGRRIWALANTKNATQLKGKDENLLYLLLATSFDGTMATQARLTNVRVVCHNTLSFATSSGRASVVIPHHSEFNAEKIKAELQIGESWQAFQEHAKAMQAKKMTEKETTRFLFDVYYGLKTDKDVGKFREEMGPKLVENFLERMQNALFNSPGAALASAKGTLWGVLNAVTYDIDHVLPSRGEGNRLNKALFGKGSTIKENAWNRLVEMVEA